jgi:hypothetical protein
MAANMPVPKEMLAKAELGEHFETINLDRPDTRSAFGNEDAKMFHSEKGESEGRIDVAIAAKDEAIAHNRVLLAQEQADKEALSKQNKQLAAQNLQWAEKNSDQAKSQQDSLKQSIDDITVINDGLGFEYDTYLGDIHAEPNGKTEDTVQNRLHDMEKVSDSRGGMGYGGGTGTGAGTDTGSGRGSFGSRNGGNKKLMVKRHGGSPATELAAKEDSFVDANGTAGKATPKAGYVFNEIESPLKNAPAGLRNQWWSGAYGSPVLSGKSGSHVSQVSPENLLRGYRYFRAQNPNLSFADILSVVLGGGFIESLPAPQIVPPE